MKTTLISLLFMVLLASSASAQQNEKFVKAMQESLLQMKAAKTANELQAMANRFELIGKNASTEWLPGYYAALCYTYMSFMSPEKEKRDQYVEKAGSLLKALPAENDETLVLKAFVAQADLAIDPPSRWMKQAEVFNENLAKAEKLNPENPRIYYLRGSNLFHTPEAFGGGAKAACPDLLKARAKFGAFQMSSVIWPAWGKKESGEMLKSCEGK